MTELGFELRKSGIRSQAYVSTVTYSERKKSLGNKMYQKDRKVMSGC